MAFATRYIFELEKRLKQDSYIKQIQENTNKTFQLCKEIEKDIAELSLSKRITMDFKIKKLLTLQNSNIEQVDKHLKLLKIKSALSGVPVVYDEHFFKRYLDKKQGGYIFNISGGSNIVFFKQGIFNYAIEALDGVMGLYNQKLLLHTYAEPDLCNSVKDEIVRIAALPISVKIAKFSKRANLDALVFYDKIERENFVQKDDKDYSGFVINGEITDEVVAKSLLEAKPRKVNSDDIDNLDEYVQALFVNAKTYKEKVEIIIDNYVFCENPVMKQEIKKIQATPEPLSASKKSRDIKKAKVELKNFITREDKKNQ